MRAIPDPGFNDWEEAMAAQPPITRRGPGWRPAHGGYPGPVPDARDVLSNLHDAVRTYGVDPATCPDCRRDYLCPYHRCH